MKRCMWAVGVGLAMGCSSGSGSGEEDDKNRDSGWTDEVGDGGGCEDTETPLGWDEDTPIGRTAETTMAYLQPGEISGYGNWADGERVEFEGMVLPDTGSAVWVDSEPAPRGDGATDASQPLCEDRLEFQFQLTAIADDGTLRLDLPMTVAFSDELGRSVRGAPGLDAVSGVDLDRFVDTSEFDTMSLSFEVVPASEEDLLEGLLYLQGEGSNGEVAWATNLEILSLRYSVKEEF